MAPPDLEPRGDARRAVPIVAIPAFALALMLATPVSAGAQRGVDLASPRAPAPSGFALDLGAFVVAPVAVGGGITLEMPGRVQIRVGIGVLPDPFGEALASVAADVARWDASTERTIAGALGGALFFETGLGLRIVEGLEIAVGYTLLWSSFRGSLGGAAGHVDVASHAVHPTLGYRVLLGDSLFVRIEAGWLHTLAGSVAITPEQPAIDASSAEAELAAALRRHAFSPTLTLAVGAHFE